MEEFLVGLQSIFDDSNQGKPIELNRRMSRIGSHVISRMILNDSNIDSSIVIELEDTGREYLYLALVPNIGDFFPSLRRFDLQGYEGQMKKFIKKYDKFFSNVLSERRKQHEEAGINEMKDFVDVLLSLPSPDNERLSDSYIKAILLDMIAANTDTSSITIEWAFVEMLRHPNVLKKAQEELDRVVGRSRLVEESDLPNLPYLHQITKEVFRMHSVGGFLPREAMEDSQIGKYAIPAGTWVFVFQWAVGRDPAVWNRAMEFDPDRFAEGTGSETKDIKGNDFDLLAFGSGRRMCAGMTMGLLTVHYSIAQLLHTCDWAMPEGKNAQGIDMNERFGLNLPKEIPLEVLATPRLHPDVYVANNIRP